jgi:hypothetical protein
VPRHEFLRQMTTLIHTHISRRSKRGGRPGFCEAGKQQR